MKPWPATRRCILPGRGRSIRPGKALNGSSQNNYMFDTTVYHFRRDKLKKQLGKGLILLLGNEDSSMNYRDNLYPFRQDSSFLYYFGLDKPGLTGIIDIDEDREIIFG